MMVYTFTKLKGCTKFIQNNKDLKDVKYFALHYKLQKKIKSIYLTNYKYYQYITGNINFLNSSLCIPPKNKIFLLSFPSLILK